MKVTIYGFYLLVGGKTAGEEKVKVHDKHKRSEYEDSSQLSKSGKVCQARREEEKVGYQWILS